MIICVIGMRYSHSCCLSRKFFKLGIKAWPENETIWTIYTKFVAIYPEGSQQLVWILFEMKQNHVKRSHNRSFKSHITKIILERELNLTFLLKRKLG
jgi:hypothetical protein